MGTCHSSPISYNLIADEVAVQNPNCPSRSRIYRHPKKEEHAQEHPFKWKTAWDIFQAGVSAAGDGPCLGQRERRVDGTFGQFQWLTYKEVEQKALRFGTVLSKLDLCPTKRFDDEEYYNGRCLRPLGIFAKNCPEWFITEQAANAFSYTLVPLYDTLGVDSIVFIVQQTEMECIVVSVECLPILNSVLSQMPSIKSIILLDARPWIMTAIPSENDPARVAYLKTFSNLLRQYCVVEPQQRSPAVDRRDSRESACPLSVSTTSSVGEADENSVSNENQSPLVAPSRPAPAQDNVAYPNEVQPVSSHRPCPIKLYFWSSLMSCMDYETMGPAVGDPDDVQTICYTSGTTGHPKGVLITHRGLVSNLIGLLMSVFVGTSLKLTPTDVFLSYLPAAHIYERIICALFYSAGGAIGVYSGEITMLVEDIITLQPSVFVGVPRVYSKIIDRIQTKINQSHLIVQALYQRGVQSKISNLHWNGWLTHPVYDRLMFNKIRGQVLGDRVRFMVSTAAAIDPHVEELLQVLFGCNLMVAYGLTETLGAAFAKLPTDSSTGNVGGLISWAEACLESVPDMKADAEGSPPKGEILIRGAGICRGYFRQPALTGANFTEGGWYHTGDIGTILPNGALKIIDRKKDIFKLSQGEYVAPEKIESVYTKAGLISQIFVHGDSSKDYLVGIVVPEFDMIPVWAKQYQLEDHGVREVINDQRFVEAVKSQMREIGSELKGFEKVKNFKLVETPFSVENGLLTPTMKKIRHALYQNFKDDIDAMYEGSVIKRQPLC